MQGLDKSALPIEGGREIDQYPQYEEERCLPPLEPNYRPKAQNRRGQGAKGRLEMGQT